MFEFFTQHKGLVSFVCVYVYICRLNVFTPKDVEISLSAQESGKKNPQVLQFEAFDMLVYIKFAFQRYQICFSGN